MSRHVWLRELVEAVAVRELAKRATVGLGSGDRISVHGSRGSSTHLLAGAVSVRSKRPVLLVVAHLDEADDAVDDLELFQEAGYEVTAARLPALEVMPGESGPNLELLAARLAVVGDVATGKQPHVLIAPIQALMQAVPRPETLHEFALTLRPGQTLPPGELLDWLASAGYTRQDAVENPGDFAARGGILDIWPPAGELVDQQGGPAQLAPIRLDFFGDEIDGLFAIDPDTLGSGARLASARLVGASLDRVQSDDRTTNLIDLLDPHTLIVLHETMELTEQARGYYERLTDPRGIFPPNALFKKLTTFDNRPAVEVHLYSAGGGDAESINLPVQPLPPFDTDAKRAISELIDLAREGQQRVVVLCRKEAERTRLLELLRDHGAEEGLVRVDVGGLHRGFGWGGRGLGAEGLRASEEEMNSSGPDSAPEALSPLAPLLLLPHHELFHRYDVGHRVRRISTATSESGQASDAFLDLEVGDYVVHVDHGIAKFTGLKTLRREGRSEEYLTLEFASEVKLHVPATQIELVQKYVGGFAGRPPLSTLGGKRWGKQKDQVAEAVKDLAAELLRVQVARETQPGIRYPDKTAWQREFEAEFPYEETQDQVAAIAAVEHDMQQPRPMDRLICGDVGFGKTEVAIRAAFKAAEFGKQVAVLVPTTVLAEQHERTFSQRMADYPFTVASLSRFKTGAEQRKALDKLAKGQVDIVIGTHRLLSEDVKFADLGLVIIDEEQRFGVEHKNKLLSFRLTADVLTMTATPIPRTLHMSMIGLRDISSLATAPVDRRAVVTDVAPYSEERIKQALVRELSRDGQVFFVHNRVHNILGVAAEIQRLAPDAKIVVGHGQMPPRELEKVMLTFIRGEADILVSTTIIESGIDIPTANTMFINHADHFGLAELHQLRGRVGRYKHRAYCYLLLPEDRPINEAAAKRLRAIEQYSMLGAGFKIAMRDLEIRGAGNILGGEQSGHIATVGYEMYCMLLEQAATRLSGNRVIQPAKTHLELPNVKASLPRKYVPSDKYRMEAYRRLSRAGSYEELDAVAKDLTDAYGEPPPPAQMLIELTRVRIAASTLGIEAIKLEGPDLIFTVREGADLSTAFATAPGRTTALSPTTLYWRPPPAYLDPPQTLLAVLRKLLTPLTQ